VEEFDQAIGLGNEIFLSLRPLRCRRAVSDLSRVGKFSPASPQRALAMRSSSLLNSSWIA